MIDLTEITDKVARSYWEKLPDRPPYDTLEPQEKVGLKQALLPMIHETATLVEAAVREQIALRIDTEVYGGSPEAADSILEAVKIARGER